MRTPLTEFFFPDSCKLKADSYSRGMTLIDTIVGSALMLLVFLGIAAAFQLSVDVVTNNKARAGAIALSNERMEYIRSLPYNSVATLGGIPAGAIAQIETVMLNGVTYTRRTSILYADDQGDGTGLLDTNAIIVDYKVVRVDVAWSVKGSDRHITLTTRVQPPSGMEINCTAPCGSILVSVFNTAAEPVQNAQVRIVNTSTNPTIDVTVFTNTAGAVLFSGVPVASGYEVTATKSGYSSAQTYAAGAQNPNPNPGHLGVSQNITTSVTFTIDYVSEKTVLALGPPTPGSWQDTFSDATKLAQMTDTEVSGGRVRVAGNAPYPPTASAESISIAPADLNTWSSFSWTDTEPGDTFVTYHIYDANGTVLLDAVLPGNSAGFTESPVDLSAIPPASYPSLRIHAVLTTEPPAGIPSIDEWTVTYGTLPPRPNLAFHMQGAKTIGSGPPPIYKYNATTTTNAGGVAVFSNFESDTYTTSVSYSTGYDIASICGPQPEYLAPATASTTRLYVALHTTNSARFEVHSQESGALLSGASVALTRTGYAATSTTDSCGQAFFPGLSNATYNYTVTKSGYAATSSSAAIGGATYLIVNL